MTSGNGSTPNEQLRKVLAGREFESIEDARAFFSLYREWENQRPRGQFQGLSSDQMVPVIYHPWASPDVITLPQVLDMEPQAPIVTLFAALAEAIGEKGIKATAKGNLPRSVCRAIIVAYADAGFETGIPPEWNIYQEMDFVRLHITRVVAKFAGLIRKYRGRFLLTRKCHKLLATDGLRAIYPRLLRAYVEKLHWASCDGYPAWEMIQDSWLFTLYLLTRFGGSKRPSEFYEDAFLQAFPHLLENLPEPPPWCADRPDAELRDCYMSRALSGFAKFFGLISFDRSRANHPDDLAYQISALPLLKATVQFKF